MRDLIWVSIVLIVNVTKITGYLGSSSPRVTKSSGETFKIYWTDNVEKCCSYNDVNDNTRLYKDACVNKQNSANLRTLSLNFILPHFNDNNGTIIPYNGGIPQMGNITVYLFHWQQLLEQLVPEDYCGIILIHDFPWPPSYSLFPKKGNDRYQVESLKIIEFQKELAETQYDQAAKLYYIETISVARQRRPKVTWGYTNNILFCNDFKECAKDNVELYNKISWLYDSVDVLSTPLPFLRTLSMKDALNYIRIALNKTMMIINNRKSPIKVKLIPSFSIRSPENNDMLTEWEFWNSMTTIKNYGVNGLILNELPKNNANECDELFQHYFLVLEKVIARVKYPELHGCSC